MKSVKVKELMVCHKCGTDLFNDMYFVGDEKDNYYCTGCID